MQNIFIAHLRTTTALNSTLRGHVPAPRPAQSVGELLKSGVISRDEALKRLLSYENEALERARVNARAAALSEDQKE
jgi:hypothetical protein